MKPSIKSADMKEVRHQKTTTNKSSSRARHLVVAKFSKVKPTDAFAKKNESSLLMNNKQQQLNIITLLLSSLFHSLIENRKSYKTR